MNRRSHLAWPLVALALASTAASQAPDLYDLDAYRAIHLSFDQPDWWTQLEDNYEAEIEIPADLTVDGVTYPEVGVRFRGNTSYKWLPEGSEKASFNIRLDSYIAGQSLYGYDHLNLNNGFHDPTFLRELLTYWLSREHGVAPQANFVTLYLNGEYWGVYINVQQPNKDMMKEWFDSNDGNRYRGFPTVGGFQNGRCALTWLGSNVQSYLDAYQAKEGDGTDLMSLCDVLNNTPNQDLQAELPYIFSVDQFFRYAAIMNITTQTDSYIGSGKDHFLYHDEDHGAFFMFPFDVNEALAGRDNLDPWYNRYSSDHPALSQTLQFPDWEERYNAHYLNIVKESFNVETLGPIILQYHNMIAADVEADDKKIYTTQQFYDNLTETVRILGDFGRMHDVPGLQPLIEGRYNFVLGRPEFSQPRVVLTELAHTPQNPAPSEPVDITVHASNEADALTLYYRVLGPFHTTAMYDDGAHGDGAANDGVYGATLPATPAGTRMDYYVEATTATGAATFLPANAEHQPAEYLVYWPTVESAIVINEFVAKNVNGIVDEAGQNEDWIELYNDSATTVDVSGLHLSDDLSNSSKWEIPAGNTIPGFGTLLIWCDEDPEDGPLHANFKLSASGEEIGLFDAEATGLINSLTFGIQIDDVATGRLFDADALWMTLAAPTPDASNNAGCGLRDYDQLDPTVHMLDLALSGSAEIGSQLTVEIADAAPFAQIFVGWGTAPAHQSHPKGGVILNNLDRTTRVLQADQNGTASLTVQIPNKPALIGQAFYIQSASPVGGGAYEFSNGVELEICPGG